MIFGAFLIIPPILVLFALPYVPGIHVRRAFIHDVIPSCRSTCTEEAIVCGAVKSLRFMWGRYLLCMLPLFLPGGFFLVHVCAAVSPPDHAFFGFGELVVWSILVALLGDVPLTIFPVARLFSRRWGMIVVLPLIVLGQIIMIGNSLFGASGFIYFTDGDPHVEEYSAFSTFILIICARLFTIGIAYFVHAACHDAEENGLMY